MMTNYHLHNPVEREDFPAIIPLAILAVGGGSYGVLYAVGGSATSSEPSPSCE